MSYLFFSPLSSINQLESHTSSYVDSNGVTHSHTSYTHHSNPGGCSGSNGIRGIKYIFCFSLFPLAIHSPFPSPFLLLHTSPPPPAPPPPFFSPLPPSLSSVV